jgi:hypothetical protein
MMGCPELQTPESNQGLSLRLITTRRPTTEQQKERSHLDILSIRTEKPLLLRILNVFQNLFLPPDGFLLILEFFCFTSRLYSSSRLLGPLFVIRATDEFFLLFFCEPGVVAVAEHVGVLARVASDESARDVGVVEKGVPEGFDEFGLVEFKVAEAFYAVGLFGLC